MHDAESWTKFTVGVAPLADGHAHQAATRAILQVPAVSGSRLS